MNENQQIDLSHLDSSEIDFSLLNSPLLKVIPLGGMGEIGKNMLVLESEGKILIIDVGLMFPTSDMYGIDIIIPDAEYVLDRLDQVQGIVLTHGHEDHIGALPYLIEQGLSAPIYATALTMGLLEGKLLEHNLMGEVNLNVISDDDTVELDPFTIDFFHTCHSFPDSVGLSIQTPAGRVIHTSDYRFDETPVDGKRTEEDKLKRWGDEGVLLLTADSTNVEYEGHTESEQVVEDTLDEVFEQAEGRILLATFASNQGRVQRIMNVARRHGRRVGVIGRSMVNNVDTAIRLGYLNISANELLTPEEMETLPPSQVVIIATGSQGEPTSAMVRMSNNDHRLITLRQGDTVVLSAKPIPGNEEYFNRTLDNLFRRGAEVVYHEVADVHVSGHGGSADYLHMLNLVRPRFFIPAHGEYRHLVLHGRLAEKAGIPAKNVMVIEDGQVVEFDRSEGDGEIQAQLGEALQSHHVFVDGLGVGDVGNVVLRDRRILSRDGFMVCIVVMDEFDNEILYGPEIISRGFIYMRDNEDMIKRARSAVAKAIRKRNSPRSIENKMKDILDDFAQREMGRRPIILPMVIEV